MRIYAHRGYSARYPENTLAAFEAALDLGVHGIELDIHCSADGIPVVIHDDRLERTTNGRGAVADLTARELSKLNAGGGEHVPTLEDVFRLAGNQVHFDLEIKARECEAAILALLDRHSDVQAAISSFDWEILEEIRKLAPDTELWVLTPAVTEEALAAAQDLKATALAVFHQAIDREAMQRSRTAGLSVMAWTVDAAEEARRLRDLGVVFLCTDDPTAIQ